MNEINNNETVPQQLASVSLQRSVPLQRPNLPTQLQNLDSEMQLNQNSFDESMINPRAHRRNRDSNIALNGDNQPNISSQKSKNGKRLSQDQEMILEACSLQLQLQSRQALLSYSVTLIAIVLFVVFLMLMNNQTSPFITIEVLYSPFVFDCLQKMILHYIQNKQQIMKHLVIRKTENKIIILENVFMIVFFVSLAISNRVHVPKFNIPYTSATFPLFLILIQRFIWYRSIVRAFKTPFKFVKFLFQFLVSNLLINLCLTADQLVTLDVVALLWPCYGFVAITFIFFIGALLLFIGSICTSLASRRDSSSAGDISIKTKNNDAIGSIVITFWIFLNCGFMLTFSIVGFMTLLLQFKDGVVFQEGYQIIFGMAMVCLIFNLIKFKKIWKWHYQRINQISAINELIYIDQMNIYNELSIERRSRMLRRAEQFEREINEQFDNEGRPVSPEKKQTNQKVDMQKIIFQKDLNELSKIQLLESKPDLKNKVLGNVPLFLVKISRSYYTKVEQYARNFLQKVTNQQNNERLRLQIEQLKQQKQGKTARGSRSRREKDYVVSSSCEFDKMSIPDEKIVLHKLYFQQQFEDTMAAQKLNIPDIENNNEFSFISDATIDHMKKENAQEKGNDDIDRYCLTSKLQSIEVIVQSDQSSSNVSISDTPGKKQKRKKNCSRRRNSFDLRLLTTHTKSEMIFPETLKQNKVKLLKELNQNKGHFTASDSVQSLPQKLSKKELLQQLLSFKNLPSHQDNQREMCMLCMERKSDAVILDCGHANICFFCAFKIYRTQKLCHLCRSQIDCIIKVQRTINLEYQKVIGIVQKIDGVFYYSDINKDTVGQVRDITQRKIIFENGDQDDIDLNRSDYLTSELIDEGSHINLNENYALYAHSARINPILDN